MSGILIVSLLFMFVGMMVQGKLKSKFTEYTAVPTTSGLSGAEIAQKMLQDHGIYDVKITSTPGALTDHYNPVNKTVNLSEHVYAGRNVSAAAVAAHECGHAVQHATAYSMLQLRSKMVPAVNISSRVSQFVILAGLGLFAGSGSSTILLIGIALFAISTLFTLITLPVEFDASKRALAWLNKTNVTVGHEHEQAKDALKWAAMTYVVAALASVAMLAQYILLWNNRRN